MPRSPKSAPKSSAKKKLSKAEREKQKLDEEERIAREAEEARILAAEEERLRKIKEKEEAGEKKKQEHAETRIRKTLMEELDVVIQTHRDFLRDRQLKKYTDSKWARYMQCDGSPDPTVLGEINTYINLKIEDQSQEAIDIELKKTALDLSLISELEYLMKNSPEDYIDDALIDQYKETVCDLQNVVMTKLDLATHTIMLSASERMHPETSNLQYYISDSNLSLSIWGNLAKNPRTKSFEFPEMQFGFDIPKILTLTDCAYRLLWCKFDHYSPYCKTYYPRVKVIKDEPDEIVMAAEEDADKEEEDGKENPDEDAVTTESMDVLAALKQLDADDEEVKEEEVVEEEEEIIDDWVGPPTPENIEWEDFDEYDDVIDLRAFGVVGGVFHLNLLQLPPQPKLVNKWVITQMVTPPGLVPLEYVADSTLLTSATQGSEREGGKKEERPSISISIKLPQDVSIVEEPQIARWDTKNRYWSTSGFDDISYNEESRTVQCKITHFGTMALLQDLHINMPFQSWEMRPRGHNHCKISVIAAILEIELEVKDDLCCLVQPEGPEFEHLINRWMKPRLLIQELQRSGINIFPSVDSSKYVSIQKKHIGVEERIYFEMALTSSVMAYSWSRWNSETGEDKFIFQGIESLEDQPANEEDMYLMMFTKRRVDRLQKHELDEGDFSEERDPDTKFTCDLYHYVLDNGSDQAKDLLNKADIVYTEVVRRLLSSIRFLTYA